MTFLMDIPSQLMTSLDASQQLVVIRSLSRPSTFHQSALMVSLDMPGRSSKSFNGIRPTTNWWLWKTCNENMLVSMRHCGVMNHHRQPQIDNGDTSKKWWSSLRKDGHHSQQIAPQSFTTLSQVKSEEIKKKKKDVLNASEKCFHSERIIA